MDQTNERMDVTPEMKTPVPPPPIEFGPEEISPPTLVSPAREYQQETLPEDVKAANRTSQIALFAGMALLAVILLMLLSYF